MKKAPANGCGSGGEEKKGLGSARAGRPRPASRGGACRRGFESRPRSVSDAERGQALFQHIEIHQHTQHDADERVQLQ